MNCESTSTLKYTGDKPYILIKVNPHGRMCFNKHNNYSLKVPTEIALETLKQWGRFFKIETSPPLPPSEEISELPNIISNPLHKKREIDEIWQKVTGNKPIKRESKRRGFKK